MKYYYSLDAYFRIVDNFVNNGDAEEIVLYPESEEILHDMETNPYSDWWGVYKPQDYSFNFADFASEAEAREACEQNIGIDVYSTLYDI